MPTIRPSPYSWLGSLSHAKTDAGDLGDAVAWLFLSFLSNSRLASVGVLVDPSGANGGCWGGHDLVEPSSKIVYATLRSSG